MSSTTRNSVQSRPPLQGLSSRQRYVGASLVFNGKSGVLCLHSLTLMPKAPFLPGDNSNHWVQLPAWKQDSHVYASMDH